LVGEFCGLSWGGDVGGGLVEEGWGEVDFSDDGLWFGDGVQFAGVGAGELQAVEESSGVLEVDLVGGERVDDFRDGDLDGDAVFEGAEVEDGSLALEVGAGDDGVAVDTVRVVQASVEVAEDGSLECDGLALEAVGTDVAAEFDGHGSPCTPWF